MRLAGAGNRKTSGKGRGALNLVSRSELHWGSVVRLSWAAVKIFQFLPLLRDCPCHGVGGGSGLASWDPQFRYFHLKADTKRTRASRMCSGKQKAMGLVSSCPMNAEEILHQFPPLEAPNSWVAVVLHPAVAGGGTEWPTENNLSHHSPPGPWFFCGEVNTLTFKPTARPPSPCRFHETISSQKTVFSSYLMSLYIDFLSL